MIPAGACGAMRMNEISRIDKAQKPIIVIYPLALLVSFLSGSTFWWYLIAKYHIRHICANAKEPICPGRMLMLPMQSPTAENVSARLICQGHNHRDAMASIKTGNVILSGVAKDVRKYPVATQRKSPVTI